jgi:glyoxalase family protein
LLEWPSKHCLNLFMKHAPLASIHHVTMLASDPVRCLVFYRDILGLRLIKRTVNFDDPETWHLYFGNDQGHPGTLLTFFPIPGLPRGRAGIRQATTIRLAVAQGSLPHWINLISERTKNSGLPFVRLQPGASPTLEDGVFSFEDSISTNPSGEPALALTDPDGLRLELVEDPQSNHPERVAGVASVLLEVEGYRRTAELLETLLQFPLEETLGPLHRHRGHPLGIGSRVDVVCRPGGPRGLSGAGTVHHVAFRTPDDAGLMQIQDKLAQTGHNVTPTLDRCYFHSIYFREPGGVLFEIATDGPGFFTDETASEAGTQLQLPPFLKGRRAVLEAMLPVLDPSGRQ